MFSKFSVLLCLGGQTKMQTKSNCTVEWESKSNTSKWYTIFCGFQFRLVQFAVFY